MDAPPTLLYKYFPPERTQFFDNLMVRFTQPTRFNDPFDCCPEFSGYEKSEIIEQILKITEKALWETPEFTQRLSHLPLTEQIVIQGQLIERTVAEKRKEYLSHPEILQGIRLKALLDRMEREIGMLCLSERADSITMWSHYAANHQGFAVAFDTSSVFFKKWNEKIREIGELRRVNYSATRPVINEPFDENSPEVDILFTKNIEWAYEREWRIVRFLKDGCSRPRPEISLYAVPPEAIKEVIFGCRSEEPFVSAIQHSVSANAKLHHICFKKARLSQNNYFLDLIDFP